MSIRVLEAVVCILESRHKLHRVLVEFNYNNLSVSTYVCFRITFLYDSLDLLKESRLSVTAISIEFFERLLRQIEQNI